MEITDLKEFFIYPLRGAIHIGAHHAQEKDWYDRNSIKPVIWIDANQEYYEIIKAKVGTDKIIISGVGNEDKEELFNISNNGQSSSFLELGTHIERYPDVYYTDRIQIKMKKMKTLINDYNINVKEYNFINIDVQGFELEVLKGFEELICSFDYIYTEININYLYKSCSIIGEIDEYLRYYKFQRVKTFISEAEWGDAFYLKKN